MPCVFLENNIVVGLDPNDPLYVDYRKNFSGEPTGKDNPELLRMHPSVGHAGSIVNGVPRIGFQKGERQHNGGMRIWHSYFFKKRSNLS